MKQVVQSARSGKLGLKEVPAPVIKSGHILVETRASLISAGTERMVMAFAGKSLLAKARARPDLVKKVTDKARRDGVGATMRAVMARLDEPLPLGYSAVGVVREVGAGLEGRFRVGERVAVAGAGLANHAELNLVPGNLAAPVPETVNDEEACFGTLSAIALHGVRNLDARLGEVVGVIGVGLVGQLAVRFLKLAGVRAIAFDYDSGRLDLARCGGAEMVWDLAKGDPTEAVFAMSGGLGCDGVVIAAATESSAPFELAASIARDRARISLVGITGTELPYRPFMQKELSVVVSRSYGPGRYDEDYEGRGMKYPPGFVRWTETENLAESLRLMSRRVEPRLAVETLISHRFPFARAPEAFALVNEGTEPHLGVVLAYDGDLGPALKRLRVPIVVAPPKGAVRRGCVLGVIGAGTFARTTLLPPLKGMKDCRLHTLVTERGISAGHSGEQFGFETASSDVEAVIDNPEINAVLIATPHSSHADLTARALAAGKRVLVEKPLALDREELNRVVEARNRSDGFFLVGFNRRFAPMSVKAKAHLDRCEGAKYLLLRVNAGALPPESWQNAPEEGHGRILGELCHFIDLARFFVGLEIKSVHAAAALVTEGACDDLTVTLNFTEGSLATIAYTAKGDTGLGKERFEIFAGGSVVTIDDFRTLTTALGGKAKTTKARIDQDKGHKAELAAFVAAVANSGPPPVDETELIESSLATIAVLESLQSGASIDL